jgi:hypothetical protein
MLLRKLPENLTPSSKKTDAIGTDGKQPIATDCAAFRRSDIEVDLRYKTTNKNIELKKKLKKEI